MELDLHLNKELFDFDDTRMKQDLVYKEKLKKKIMYCFNYLETRLPINKLTKKNTFNFKKLKVEEGKSYKWFFLTNDKVKVLVRQYDNHFTFFSVQVKAQSYFNKLAVFTIYDDLELLMNDGKLHDSYVDNRYKTLEQVLPKLFETIAEGRINGIWNNYSFERPKHTKVKLAFVGDETVHSLDDLIFACDEIFQTFLEKFAENDLLDKLKTLNVGDVFGDYTITEVRTNVKDNYYHGVGLGYYRTDDVAKEKKWDDVYSLTRWYYEALYFGNTKEIVNNFIFEHHSEIFDKMVAELDGQRLFISDIIYNTYYKLMYEKFSETEKNITIKDFIKSVSKNYNTFLYYSYMMVIKQSK